MSFSTRCMLPEDWAQLQFFRPHEFARPDVMGYEFMLWLDQDVRKVAAVAMVVVSSWRDPVRLIGAKDSAHGDVPCDVVDIGRRPTPSDPNWNYHRFRIVTAAINAGCTRIGIYPSGSLHIDRTEGRRPGSRIWIAVDNPAQP